MEDKKIEVAQVPESPGRELSKSQRMCMCGGDICCICEDVWGDYVRVYLLPWYTLACT
jgi:hypothetical protein